MVGVFELFKIGIGPSSSHTVGPDEGGVRLRVGAGRGGAAAAALPRVEVVLFGSLAWTGRGHGTDKAVILGLAGFDPATVDPDAADAVMAESQRHRRAAAGGRGDHRLRSADRHRFDVVTTPARHPNTLRFVATDAAGAALADETWCSVGGGFICRETDADTPEAADESVPHPFRNGDELLREAARAGLTIAELVEANERARHDAGRGRDPYRPRARHHDGLHRPRPRDRGHAAGRAQRVSAAPRRSGSGSRRGRAATPGRRMRSWTTSASTPWR